MENALDKTQYNIWKAIAEWEMVLKQKDLITRVKDEKILRESRDVIIIDYKDDYKDIFRQLNEEWIKKHFKMEEADYKLLGHPRQQILDHGGYILIALYKGKAVGTCALIKAENQVYELAKMAVADEAKGKSIGFKLGKEAIEKARQSGARKIYLESNTILKPAIQLYRKLGFREVSGIPSPYKRCNIQMELNF